MKVLDAFLGEHQEPVPDYNEGQIRKLIEPITVFEDRLAFAFKCGFETVNTKPSHRRSYGGVFLRLPDIYPPGCALY